MKLYINIQIFAQQSITWQKTYSGPTNGRSYGNAICKANYGCYYLAGTTETPIDKSYLIKINEWGDTLWTALRGIGTDWCDPYDVVRTNDSGCVLCGRADYLFFTRYDKNGLLVWEKKYTGPANIIEIVNSSDGGFVACGTKQNKGYICKINSSGEILWDTSYLNIAFYSIIKDNQYFVVTGPDFGNGKIRCIKLTESGNIVWDKSYQIYNSITNINYIRQISNDYILFGMCKDSINPSISVPFFMKINSQGDTLFKKLFSNFNNDEPLTINTQLSSHLIFVTYHSISGIGDSTYNRIVMTDINGAIEYEKRIKFPFSNYYLNDIERASNNDILFFGDIGAPENYYVLRTDTALNYPPYFISVKQISEIVPDKFKVYQNYPNPFNSTSVIKYYLKENTYLNISLININGRTINILADKIEIKGEHKLIIDCEMLASGVYFVIFKNKDFLKSIKILYIK